MKADMDHSSTIAGRGWRLTQSVRYKGRCPSIRSPGLALYKAQASALSLPLFHSHTHPSKRTHSFLLHHASQHSLPLCSCLWHFCPRSCSSIRSMRWPRLYWRQDLRLWLHLCRQQRLLLSMPAWLQHCQASDHQHQDFCCSCLDFEGCWRWWQQWHYLQGFLHPVRQRRHLRQWKLQH